MITDERRVGTGVTSEEHRALAFLANDPNGVTEAMLVAHGFAVPMLARLVVDGLVIARHEASRGSDVVRVKITNAGRAALKRAAL
jgi:DNA-binding PadR family transcriptional regulator